MFLMRFTYTPETWRALMLNPEDRSEAAREYVEAVGGSSHGFWYGLGESDGYFLFEVPDEVAAASVTLAVTAGGAMSSIDVTPLMSVEDTLTALDKGHAVKYRKPGEPAARAMAHAPIQG